MFLLQCSVESDASDRSRKRGRVFHHESEEFRRVQAPPTIYAGIQAGIHGHSMVWWVHPSAGMHALPTQLWKRQRCGLSCWVLCSNHFRISGPEDRKRNHATFRTWWSIDTTKVTTRVSPSIMIVINTTFDGHERQEQASQDCFWLHGWPHLTNIWPTFDLFTELNKLGWFTFCECWLRCFGAFNSCNNLFIIFCTVLNRCNKWLDPGYDYSTSWWGCCPLRTRN